MIKALIYRFRDNPRHFLVLAALFHLAVTTMVFSLGRFSLMPSQFDRDGIGQFAADGHIHLGDAIQMTNVFETEGAAAWFRTAAPLHVRAYSLTLIPLHHLFGFNIMTIEPVNLLLYLAMLAIVFRLTESMFDRRAAWIAATLVALWPTLLVHSTQPLRDPLLIVALLAFFLIMQRWLTEIFNWRQLAIIAVCGVLVLLTIWVVRLAMWDISRVVVVLGFLLVIAGQLWKRKLAIPNLVFGLVLILAVFAIPQFNRQLQFLSKRDADNDRLLIGEKAAGLPIWERVIARRNGFINRLYDEDYRAGSDIDSGVRFQNRTELILYLPRAAAIGLWAPFPNAWFAPGMLVGRTGRIISGGEMVATYMLEVLALFGLWRARRDVFAWLLAVIAILGVTALGLIVINVGSLYRLRYPYWIFLAMLGAGGAVYVWSRVGARNSVRTDGVGG